MATEGGSLGTLVHVYKFVVEDVIRNVKEDFLNEGVEPEVLDQLQELWLRKEDLTDAVNRPRKPQFDPVPAVPLHPPLHAEQPTPRFPPALIHQPLPPLLPPLLPPPSTTPLHNTGPQSQESVIQLAPPRIPLTTPTLPITLAAGTTQISHASPSSLPSPHHLQLLSQAGYQVAMTTQGTPQQTETGSSTQASGVVGVSGVGQSNLGVPGLMPQLVVNPAALQSQQVLVPVPTSQGTIMVPLASVLAMQQVAVANQQNQSRQSTSDDSVTATSTVQQIDGLPPEISLSQPLPLPRGRGDDGRGTSGCGLTRSDPFRTLESPPTDLPAGTSACKKKADTVPREIPPGVLQKLLRQQRRRKKQGKVGGVPVEVIVQVDGPGGDGKGGKVGGGGEGEGSSSEEESDGYGDSSEEEEVEQVDDDDPLGSDDDEADSEHEDKDFDTEDTIACQWEKVYRVKAKWKFQLKDGIMRMGGFEYVFHKASGEAEW